MAQLATTLFSALASNWTIFLSSIAATMLCLRYLGRIFGYQKTTRLGLLLSFAAGCLNGGLGLLLAPYFYRSFNLLAVLLPPLAIYAEFILLSRNRLKDTITIFGAVLMNYGFLYYIAIAIAELWACEAGITHTVGLITAHYYSLTMLLNAVFYLAIASGGAVTPAMIRALVNPKRGLVGPLWFYLGLSFGLLTLTTLLSMPAMRVAEMPEEARHASYIELLLRMLVLMANGYLILVVQGRGLKHAENVELLEDDLFDEQAFRRNLTANAIFSYEANISQNRMVRGQEAFSEALWGGQEEYLPMIARFTHLCVHPEDQHILFNTGGPDYYTCKLETEPSYSLRFRASPPKLLQHVQLPPQVHDRLAHAASEWMWVQIHSTITRTRQNEIYAFISLEDIDDQMRREEALRRSASTDPLTKCFNRAAFELSVREYLGKEGADARGTLLMLDMDHFKDVNDTFGHPRGDALLIEMAELLRGVFRANDIIARLGGDEFAMFLRGFDGEEVLARKLMELQEASRIEVTGEDGQTVRVSASVGAARCPADGREYQALYEHADAALYAAKQAGRDTFRIFEAE